MAYAERRRPEAGNAFSSSARMQTSRPPYPLTLYPHAWRLALGLGR
jgi:hypothetical protein